MFDKDKCPICANKATHSNTDRITSTYIKCVRCGVYILSSVYEGHLNDLNEYQIANLSGYIRDNQRGIITRQIIEKNKLDDIKYSPIEKVDRILISLEEIDKKPGAEIEITEGSDIYYMLLGKAYVINQNEWIYIFQDYLEKELGYIEFIKYVSTGPPRNTQIKITPKGWDHLSKLRLRNQDSGSAFIAMWFNPKVEGIRKSIKQAIQDAGYEPKIVDEEEHNDDVTDKIITMIKRAKFVVADFTEQRAGVYYEAGYAKGINIPVIHTVKENEIGELHFDINHQNFIAWNETNLSEFQEKLTNRITATIGDGPHINND